MFKKKKDWLFIAGVAVMTLLTLADANLTYLGVGLGLEEGNPVVVWTANLFGLKAALLIMVAVVVTSLSLLLIVRLRTGEEWKVKACYGVLGFALIIRAFVVGGWVGALQTLG